jgi:hypothetical protein
MSARVASATSEGDPILTAEDEASGPSQRESLVEVVLSEHAERHRPTVEPPKRLEGIVIGVLAGLAPGGEPLVDFVANPRGEPVPARSTVSIDVTALGRDVALMFEGGHPPPGASGTCRGRGGGSPGHDRTGGGRSRRTEGRRLGGAGARPSLRQREHYPHPRGKDPHPRRLRADPFLWGQPHPGRLGPDQLTDR